MSNPVAEFTLSPKQMDAFREMDNPDTDELLYGGAKGGGKSVFGCIWSYKQAKWIKKEFNLGTSQYPLVVGFMGRKQSVDFNTTTLDTWKRFIPAEAYELKKQEKLIVIENSVAIRYGGMDRAETVKKFNSAEYAFYFIDQAEEVTESDIGLLRGTRRLKINNRPLPYKGLLTANPAICWLKEAFIDEPQAGNKFIQALPADNPFLPADYVAQLQKAFAFKPELLKAYLYGSWDDLDTANIVIPMRDVKLNVNNEHHDKSIIKRITVADISSEGDDETVIYDLINTKIVNQEIYSHRSLMDTCGRLQAHARENKSNLICVDKIGEGKGVYDRLSEIYGNDESNKNQQEVIVYGFDSRVNAEDDITFGNKRAEAWWRAAHKFAERKCDIPNDPILIRQLAGVTYHFHSRGKIYIDPKDKLVEQLRRSPDRADTYVMALDALEIAPPYKKVDGYMRETESDYDLTPETC
jgi:phage terminase large subunit